ncbi:group 1 glycosyl transferase [Anopheles sinensis]|uniref:Group 1 glycosyl transferase n=1 Tax=Anopheles sinensis TaxID=74873 RepID=A0A084VS10_ANOSI|nr:group 1 glycosyl transferase [Anopheles sinensis]
MLWLLLPLTYPQSVANLKGPWVGGERRIAKQADTVHPKCISIMQRHQNGNGSPFQATIGSDGERLTNCSQTEAIANAAFGFVKGILGLDFRALLSAVFVKCTTQ